MRNSIIIFLLLVVFRVSAQTPVKSLADDDVEIPNAYYKDLSNELDAYVGTWKYMNGTTSLTLVIEKRIMQFINGSSIGGIDTYEDILIGEYQYIENGIEKVNTLPELLIPHSQIDEYHISGNTLIYPGTQFCRDCGENDRKVMLGFMDANNINSGYWAYLFLQRVDSGNIQKLKIKLVGQGPLVVDENAVPFTGFSIPEDTYILEKQP